MDLSTLVPAGGIAGVLAFVILYLLNSNRQDRIENRKEREDYRQEIVALRQQHREDLARLELRVDQVERELEDERRARIAAEAATASERLRALAAEHQLALVRIAPPPPEST